MTTPAGFGHLEVPQVAVIDDQPVLLFSAGTTPEAGEQSGIWVATGSTSLGPWDVASAKYFQHPSLYAARVVHDSDGSWALIGFINQVEGQFVGELTDPIAIRAVGVGAPGGIRTAGDLVEQGGGRAAVLGAVAVPDREVGTQDRP